MYQNHPAIPGIESLPTMYDLPSEDPEEMGLPDEFHDFQPKLLRETCQPTAEVDFLIGADLNLYYDVKHTSWYKRPDWFLVLGVPASQSQAELRWSYVMWQEGVAPFLVVELLSPGTEAEDLGQTLRVVGKPPTKWQVYEQILRVPYYVLYDRYSNQFRLFCLQGARYVELTVSGQGFWFEELELGLGIWEGVYFGIAGKWLNWYDRSGNWIGTDREQLVQAQQQADAASQRADAASQEANRERARADLLAAKLRELGIDLD
ncbi:Uma2 family endonuclease [Chamaesiphon sp.]|uniref:Uma2 family endonuclease n=1 Tax=Chamaesiphon sp. TaxID=2814140 RepID=UPI0035945C8E